MSEKLSSAKPTSMKTNIAFALSELACNPLYTIMIAVLVYFYTDVVGMDPAIVGTIILVSKVFDGISDIIAGNIIDHTHTKAGSARPWYLRMAIPMALSYIMLFTVPNWSTGGKVAYIFVSYNVVSTVVYTLTNAAMASFPTFLTKHRESRSVMSTFRLFVACGTQMLLLIIIFPFVEMLGGGQGGWIKMAVILGTFAAVVLTFVYFNTKEESAGDEKEANDVLAWDKLQELMDNDTVIAAKVSGVVNAGVVAYVEGIRGFIPASKLSLSYVEDLNSWLFKEVRVKIITLDRERKKLVLSAKEVLKEEAAEARNSKIAAVPIGLVTEGTVETLQKYGAFIDLGNGLSGLVHISQISNKRIKHPGVLLHEGDKVKVKVIDIKDGKISLSMKALEDVAAEEIEEETYDLPDTESLSTNLGSLFANIKLDS